MADFWRPLTIGVLGNAGSYRIALAQKNRSISDAAHLTLDGINMQFLPTPTVVRLAKVGLHEMDCDEFTPYPDIVERAKALGLLARFPEVGPALSVAYDDQPLAEILVVASEPVRVSKEELRLFAVGHGHVHGPTDSRYLAATPSWKRFARDRQFVFEIA